MTPRRALIGLIVVSGLLRLGWAASLGPGNDEAYHYLFTVHRDWSYFDHPPMLAWVETAGIAAAGGVVSPFSLRLGFVALFAGSTWLMYRLGTRFHGEWAGLLAAFGLNVTAYHTAAAATFALPDGPLLFFWLLTLDRLAAAMSEPAAATSRRREFASWTLVGLAWGCTLLSKYHGVFLPLGAFLYMLAEPTARGWLRRPGPYLATILGLMLFSPVLIWNARHGWVSFLFQAGRAVGGGGVSPRLVAAALVGPALYLFPWIWARLIAILVGQGRRAWRGEATAGERFLLSQAVPPLGTFLAVACTREVLPHWTLVGFLPLYPLLGASWAGALQADPRRFRRRAAVLAVLPVLLGALMLFQIRTGFFQAGRPGGIGLVRVSRDPTTDLVGWDQVRDELARRGLLGRPDTFLFTSSWYHSGQLGFATRGSSTPVLCYSAWDARSFAFWSKPSDWVGREGILVAVNDLSTEPGRFDKWFARIEPIGDFAVDRGGAAIRKVRLYRCTRQTFAFPFDDLGRTIRREDRGKGRTLDPRQIAAGSAPARPAR